MLMTSTGHIFAWGDNSAQRLGIDYNMTIHKPTLVDELMGRHVINVGLGGLFNVIVTGPAYRRLIDTKFNIIRSLTSFVKAI